jgi:hypothetical protein
VQVDPDYDTERAERGRPVIRSFNAEAWNGVGVRPSHPVTALLTVGAVTLPSLRYVCKPDFLAFEGSEWVDR